MLCLRGLPALLGAAVAVYGRCCSSLLCLACRDQLCHLEVLQHGPSAAPPEAQQGRSEAQSILFLRACEFFMG